MAKNLSFFLRHFWLSIFQMLASWSPLCSLCVTSEFKRKTHALLSAWEKNSTESRSDLAEYSVFLVRIASPSFSVVSSFARDERFSRGRRRAFHRTLKMATKQHNPNASLSRETAPNGMQQHRPQQQQQQLQQPTATTTTTAMMNASNSMENSWAQAYSAAMYNQQQQKGGNVTQETPTGLAPPHFHNPHLAASLNNPAFAAHLLMATSALQPQANGLSPDMAAVAAAGMMMGAPPLYPQQNPQKPTKTLAVGNTGHPQKQGAQIKLANIKTEMNQHPPLTTNNNNKNNKNNAITKDRKRLNNSSASLTTTTTTTTTTTPPDATIINNNNKTSRNKTAQATVVSPIATIDTSNKTPTADDRELKRQRRKQSNRESARRSRLRKQAETEELGNILERYATENMKLREAVEKLASERDIRTENESVLAKCIEDAGNKVPDLKQVEKPFVVSSLELFSSNNINNNDGSDTTTNSGGGEGTNNSTDG